MATSWQKQQHQPPAMTEDHQRAMDAILRRSRLDFGGLKAGFAHLMNQAEPHSLPAFILWLDLKVGQFKVNGCMYPDTLHEETWVAYAREVLEKVNTNIKQHGISEKQTPFGETHITPNHTHMAPSNLEMDDFHREQPANNVSENSPLSLVTKRKMASTSPTISSSTNVSSAVSSSKLPLGSPQQSSPVRVNGHLDCRGMNGGPQPHSPVKKLHYGLSPIKKRPLPHDLLCNEAEISTRSVPAPNYIDCLRAESISPPPPPSMSSISAPQPLPSSHDSCNSSTSVGSVLGTLRSLLSDPAPSSTEVVTNMPSTIPVNMCSSDASSSGSPMHHGSYNADRKETSATKEALKMVITKKRRQRRKRTSPSHPESPTLPTPSHPPADVGDIPTSGLDLSFSSSPLPSTVTEAENSPSKLSGTVAAWSPSKEDHAPSSPKSHNVCPICYRKFDYRSSFRRHMRIHEGVYSHQCAVCGRKFTRKEHFDRHKCSRRPNKPNRSADSVGSTPTKRIKVAFPPTTAGNEPPVPSLSSITEGSESVLHGRHPEGMLDDSLYFEKENTVEEESLSNNHDVVMGSGSVGVLAHAAVLHLAESRRKSSNPRKVIAQEEEAVQEIDDFYNRASAAVPDNSESDCVSPQVSPPVPPRAKSPSEDHSDYSESLASPLPGDMGFADIAQLVASSSDSDIPDRLREYIVMSPAHSVSEDDDGVPTPFNGDSSGSEFTLDTGNYKVSEEEMMSMEGCESIETTSHGRFIKVTKQGKYLKLKNEVQVINGHLCFVCPNCSKVFHRSSNFSRHMRIHRGVYSYICPTCHRGFFRKEHFQKHKCHRKSMSHIWERKTKLDLVLKPKNSEPDGSVPSTSPVPRTLSVSESTDENGPLDNASEEGDRLYIDENPQTLL